MWHRQIDFPNEAARIAVIRDCLSIMGFDAGNAAYPGKRFSAEQRAALTADMNAAGFQLK